MSMAPVVSISDDLLVDLARECESRVTIEIGSRSMRGLLLHIAELKRDAERYRWLCDGNGYFMEEQSLCHVINEKHLADAVIDAAMTK